MFARSLFRHRSLAFFATLALFSAACSDSAPTTPAVCAVSNVDLQAPVRSIFPGGTTTLSASVASANCASAPTVAWSSNATNIATVSSAGVVTGVAAGNFIITAAAIGVTDTVNMTVALAPVNTVEIAAGNRTVIVSQTLTLTATTKDAQGATLTGRAIAWSSASATVATVNPTTGVVSGVAPGTSNITATSEGKTATTTVTVSAVPVSSVTVTVPSLTMAINATQQATAVARDAAGNVLSGRTVNWSSSNTAVATVSSAGSIGAVAPGAAAITATVDGVPGLVAISVLAPPAPTVNALSPLSVDAVFASVPISITGTNFQPGATSVAFTGTGITAGALNVPNATSMAVPMLIAGGTAATTSNFTVTTAGGTSAARQISVSAVGAATMQPTAFIGGPGGVVPYLIDCAAGSVATGFNTRIGAWLDNIQVRCQSVTGASRTFGAVVPSFSVGGAGGFVGTIACNAGSVMTGISGTYTNASVLNIVTLAAICSPIDGSASFTTAPAGGAPGAATFSTSCPLGLVVVGLQGNYGAYVDSVQPRCR